MYLQPVNDFSDLDILLVNSEKFNQVFIQKTKPVWMNQILQRLAQSPTHFNKLVEILVDMVVSQKHPEWTKRALMWLTKIAEQPDLATMLTGADSFGIGGLLDSAVKAMSAASKPKVKPPKRLERAFLNTHYVFVDDSDDNFGRSLKRRRRNVSGLSADDEESNVEGQLSLLSSDSAKEDDESEVEDEDEDQEAVSEDDGVFDVDNGSMSSFPESICSLPPLHPDDVRTKNVKSADDDQSDDDEEEDDVDESSEDCDEEEDDEEGSEIPPEVDDDEGEEEDKEDDDESDASSEVSIPDRGSASSALIPRPKPQQRSPGAQKSSRRR